LPRSVRLENGTEVTVLVGRRSNDNEAIHRSLPGEHSRHGDANTKQGKHCARCGDVKTQPLCLLLTPSASSTLDFRPA
jgi:hypothetical protein